ncbi:hypothetical protein DIPPA_04332 [Diplonema papillatum]|nr:hypothetical protein DIPPA_04332 [Diplonema papillatum]
MEIIGDKKVRGSYHYLHSCGRREQRFNPFHNQVTTTLRVGKVLDRYYDVKYGHSSRNRRVRSVRLGQDSGARTPSQKDKADQEGGPDMCSYNPGGAIEKLKEHGRLGMQFGKAPRMLPPVTPSDREGKSRDFEQYQQELREQEQGRVRSPSPFQDQSKPVRHVPAPSFGPKTPGRASPGKPRPPKLAIPRSPSSRGPPEPYRRPRSADGTSANHAFPQLSKDFHHHHHHLHPSTPQPVPISRGFFPHSPSPHHSSSPGAARGRMVAVPWNVASLPPESLHVEYPEKILYPADKNTAAVDLSRTSGRERKNMSKDNVEALERLLKKVSVKQAAIERKATLAESIASPSPTSGKGRDMWLSGGRMGIAVQGRIPGADDTAATMWVVEEAASVSRRVQPRTKAELKRDTALLKSAGDVYEGRYVESSPRGDGYGGSVSGYTSSLKMGQAAADVQRAAAVALADILRVHDPHPLSPVETGTADVEPLVD